MLYLNYSRMFCIKFDFGVPLEDIFPPNDIHPKLQDLFDKTALAVDKYRHVPLHYILSIFDVSLIEIFDLKEDLISGKLKCRKTTEPSYLLWLIRHFLGLLPLPLFPSFTNNIKFNWGLLAAQCRIAQMATADDLIHKISWLLHKLPEPNIMLIYTLLELLRKISKKKNNPKKLDRVSVIAVTTYFSSCLFFRPYRPGSVTSTDKLYYPLLCYMIINWRQIRKSKKFHGAYFDNRLYCIREDEEFISQDKVSGICRDFGCQTSYCRLHTNTNDKSIKVLVPRSEESLKNLSKYSQTEELMSLKCDKICEVDFSCRKDEEEQDNMNALEEKKKDAERQKAEKNVGRREAEDEIEYRPDDVSYIEIVEDKLNASSKTSICTKEESGRVKLSTPKVFLKKKLTKANRSLVDIISKMNHKIKSKQELLTRSGTKLENCKYNLLKDSNVVKVQSLPVNHCITESPNIKYEKLKTL